MCLYYYLVFGIGGLIIVLVFVNGVDLRNIIYKAGFANIASALSLLISLTCFVMVAQISSEYTHAKMEEIEPDFIEVDQEETKIIPSDNNTKRDPIAYNNLLNDIDNLVDKRDGGRRATNVIDDEEIKAKIAAQGSRHKRKGMKNVDSDPLIRDTDEPRETRVKVAPVAASNSIPMPRRAPAGLGKKTSLSLEDVIDDVTDSEHKANIVKTKIHLGTFGVREDAISAWFRLQNDHPSLQNHSYYIEEYVNGNDIMYKVLAGTNSNEEAEALCDVLKHERVDCLVVD